MKQFGRAIWCWKMKVFTLAALISLAGSDPVLLNQFVWQSQPAYQTYNPVVPQYASSNFAPEEIRQFDRSGVEVQPPVYLRKSLSGPYIQKTRYFTSQVDQNIKFYRGHVEAKPQSAPRTYSNGFDYYGAAKSYQQTLDQTISFPKSRAEVEGRPTGISVSSARKEYLQRYKAADAQDLKMVCYYGGWAVYRKSPMSFRPDNLDGVGCTHIIFSFAGLDEKTNKIVSLDPKLEIEEAGYKNVTNLRSTNKGLKVMIAIGGWNEGVKKYSDMVSDGSTRKNFVDSVVEFVGEHNFDGLDLDWEYPGDSERGGKQSDRDNYSLLVEELRAAFDPKGWLLTAAVPAPQFRVDAGYDVKRIAKSLDFINVMTYDLHGSWDNFADHHSPLKERPHDYWPFNTLNSAFAMNYWHQQGAPKNKLVMGIPFYGRSFLLVDQSKIEGGPDAASSGDGFQGEFTEENGFLAYYEICKLLKDEPGWKLGKDSDGNVYAYNGQKWVGYDTPENVRRKVQYVKSHGFGGAMTWAIDLDDFNGVCGEKWPLVNAMKQEIESTEIIPIESDADKTEDTSNQGQESYEPLPDRPNFDCPSPGLFASPFNCNEFYECTTTPFLRKCAPGLHFDTNSKICNWPDQANCKIQPAENNNVYSGNLCQTLYDGLYSDPADCSKMFWCAQGVQSKLVCPFGQTFDSYSGTCSFYTLSRCASGVLQQAYFAPNWFQAPLAPYHLPYQTLVQPTFKAAKDKNVVCYFTNWANERDGDGEFVPENIDARLCSHLIYAYANLDSASLEIVPSNPRIDVDSGYFNRLQSAARSQNPQVKVLLGLGGWTDSSNGEKYSKLVNDQTDRSKFVEKTVKMLEIRGFDGLSLEWHFPVCWQSDCQAGNSNDKTGFVSLIRELKDAFKPKKLLLSASLSGYVDKVGDAAYDVQALGGLLDFANVMTYDYHGFWDRKTGHHSPISEQPDDKQKDYNLVYAMNFYASKGFPKEKLNAGLPFYGQSFFLAGDANQIGAPSSGPGIPGKFTLQNGMLSYYEICSALKSNILTKAPATETRGPYAFSANRQWVGYDDVETITKKSNFIVESGYGGAAVWTLDLDDFNNLCCQGTNPLLNAASEVLRGVSFKSEGNCQRPPQVSTPAPPPQTTATSDGGSNNNDWDSGSSGGGGDNNWVPKPPKKQTTTTSKPTIETTTSTTSGEGSPPSSGQLENGQFCRSENEYYADPSNCQNYFRCVNKRIIQQSCSQGLLWSQTANACEWPATVKCGSRKNPIGIRDGDEPEAPSAPVAQPVEPEQPAQNAGEDSGENDYDYHANPELDDKIGGKCEDGEYGSVEGDCSLYTACSNGIFYRKECSPGLHWVQSKLSCDWPEASGCKESSGNTPSFRANKGHHYSNGYSQPIWFFRYLQPKEPFYSGDNCQEGVLSAHHTNCGNYLFCVHGKFVVFPCQPGTHWNAQQKICDHPASAGCTGDGTHVETDSSSQSIEVSQRPVEAVVDEPDYDGNVGGGSDGGDNSGQWEWKPPTTTTTETSFIETSQVKQPLSGDYKVVCYFTNWAWYRPGVGKYTPNDIDPTICTHVVYGFATLDYSNLVIKPHDDWADLDNQYYLKVTSLKKLGIKVTLAIGGWNDSEGDKYSRLVNNPAARAKFVEHVVEFVTKYNFDGLDLDWEYPSCWQVDCKDEHKSDKEGFAAWVKELKDAFRPKGLLLSAAVSPSKKVIDYAYDVPSIARDLDWIAVMTYDYHGHWDKKTGHVSPMFHHPEAEFDYFNTNFTMHYWMEKGAPKEKLIMGMPLYGQAFTLDSASTNGLNAPAGQKGQEGQFTRQAGFLAYYEICPKIKEGWTVVQDPEGRIGPYAYNQNHWVSYDDVKMIEQKSQFIRDLDLGGGMVWALDLDDFQNVCGEGHHPLMNTIKKVLGPPKAGGASKDSRNKQSSQLESHDTFPLVSSSDNLKVDDVVLRQSTDGNDYKVVCYFTNWANYRPDQGKFLPEDTDSNLCTHIVFGFAVLNPQTLTIRAHDSYVDFDLEFYKRMTALKSKDKKVLLAIGGWNDSEGDKYSRLVSDPIARQKFTSTAVDFIKQHNFDGLDLDWEYPTCWQVDCSAGPETDKDNFAAWVKELSTALKAEGLLLTAAVSPSAKVIAKAYDIPALSQYLDYVSIMTYDYHGQWDKVTGHVAPIKEHPDDADKTFNVEYTVQYWLNGGLDRKKLILGLPLYGQSFTLADPSKNGLNAPTYGGGEAGTFTRARGFLSYYEICERVTKQGWAVVRDPEGRMGPYAYKGNQWVSFDDLDTVQQKIKYLRDQNLGGAMVWALDLDDFRGTFCPAGDTYPLLRTINSELGLIPPLKGDMNTKLLQGLSENEVRTIYEYQPPQTGFSITFNHLGCNAGTQLKKHDNDCNKFLQCNANGQYEETACPPGLHWNDDKSICDWPESARCEIGGSQEQVNPVNPTAKPPAASPPPVEAVVDEDEDVPPPPAVSGESQDTGKLVVCYYTNWSWYRQGTGKYVPEDIDSSLCTHINFGFTVLDPNQLTIKTHDPWSDVDNKFYERIVALKGKNTKVLVAIGGWNDSEGSKYSKMANDPSSRSRFISSALEFIDKYKFDGLDLDWEYPVCWQVDCKQGPQSDKDGFSALVKELSAAFKPKGLLLTAAVSPSKKVIDEGYDVPVLNEYLDHINVMTYDYYGHWDKQTGHVAPLFHHPDAATFEFNVNFTMNYWVEKGADKKKLIVGMPMYGQTFTLNSPTPSGLGVPGGKGLAGEFTKQEGFTAYYEICHNIKTQGWQLVRDDAEVERMGPYATQGLQWVGFDDSKTIRDKSNFVLDQNFGGAMIWALDLDDFANRCGCEKYPLLRTINRVLRKYSIPDPGCDLKSTPGVKKQYFNPSPVYGSPWVLSSHLQPPYSNVYYPQLNNFQPQFQYTF